MIGILQGKNDPSKIFDPCFAGRDAAGNELYKPARVGVDIEPYGFKNRVEAEIFSAAAMNIQLKDPQANYCLVPSVEKSERKLDIRVNLRIIDREIGSDEFKTQMIRMGVKTALDPLLVKIFGRRYAKSIGTTIRNAGGKYTNEPRITVYTIQVTAETKMRNNGKVLWEGSSSRVFLLKKTVYPRNIIPTTNEIISLDERFDIGAEMRNLVALYKIRDIPDFKNAGPRAEQFLMLFATREALDQKNIRLAQPSYESQITTGGGKQKYESNTEHDCDTDRGVDLDRDY